MNTRRPLLALTVALLVAPAAHAGDTGLTKLLSASAATLPAAAEPSPLHPATEAAIRAQMAVIDARMTATLAAPTEATAPAKSTELAAR
ncbi:MAG: hypothetical protein VYC42_14155 [Pseudomonadota bacterium]|nr:hypothetical protein [Pseudomonadota bacterium]